MTNQRALARSNLRWERRCVMANPLLDFVMSLVRDPDAAAQLCRRPGAGHPRRQSDRCDQRRRQRADPGRLGVAVDGGADHRRGLLGGDAGRQRMEPAGRRPPRSTRSTTILSVPVIDDGHSVATNVIEQPDDSLHAGLDALARRRCSGRGGCRRPVAQFTDGSSTMRRSSATPADTDWQSSRRRRPSPPGRRRLRLRHLRLGRTRTSTTARPATAAPFSCCRRR